MSEDPTILEVRALRAGYGEALILNGIDLDVRAARISTVIGPNGAGKSTLIRAIFGTVRATSGSIVFGGREVTNRRSIERLRLGIAYCPQGRSNFPRMTVRENIEMGAYQNRNRREVRAAIERLMDLFPLLRARSSEFVGNLSGGQQQIVEMAMALVMEPQLLLIDEPSIGLSPQMVDEVFAYIQTINKEGVTVLLVEQNAKRALAISDYGVVLELGRVLRVDAGAALLDDPEVRRNYLGGSGRKVVA